MELVDRYLKAVRFWLPKARQPDILAELSEGLRVQIDEKEAELGRKLHDADTEAILQRSGDPMLVAEQYRPPLTDAAKNWSRSRHRPGGLSASVLRGAGTRLFRELCRHLTVLSEVRPARGQVTSRA